MLNRLFILWTLLLAFCGFLIYANLEIRAYNKLIVGIGQVNEKLLVQMKDHKLISSKRFEKGLKRQFIDRDPHEVGIDLLSYLENTGASIKHLEKRDSIWMVQVVSNNRDISFSIIEGNNLVLLDSCTNIPYICGKMDSKRALEADLAKENCK